jgi:hypothetical protein
VAPRSFDERGKMRMPRAARIGNADKMSLGGADRFTVDEPIYRHSHPSLPCCDRHYPPVVTQGRKDEV